MTFNINIGLSIILVLVAPAVGWVLKDRINQKILVFILITFSFGLSSYTIKDSLQYEKIIALDKRTAKIEGTIISYPTYTDTGVVYDVKIDKVFHKGINRKFKTKLYMLDSLKLELYDKFEGNVRFFNTHKGMPLGLQQYFKSKEYFVGISNYNSDEFSWTTGASFINAPHRFIISSREYFKTNLTKCFNKDQYQGNIMIGILLGDKSGVDEDIKMSFSRSGMSYLLAVAGLQLSILIQSFYQAMMSIRLNKKMVTILCVIATIFFVAVSGFSASAVRAGIMHIIYMIGRIIDRDSDSLNSLGLALLLILIVNPFAAIDIGLQLSFMATLGIILFDSKIYKMLVEKSNINNIHSQNNIIYKVKTNIIRSISMSTSAIVLTIPVTITQFGQVSLIAPITSLVLTPIIQPTLIAIMIMAIIGGIEFISLLYKIVSVIASIGIFIIKYTVDIMASIPFSCISINNGYIYISLMLFVILAIVCRLVIKKPKMYKYIVLLSVINILIGKLSNDIVMNGVIFYSKIDEDKNYIIGSLKSTVLVISQTDKYLIKNIEEKIKNLSLGKLKTLIISSKETDMKNVKDIMKVIKIYKPKELTANKNTVSKIFNNMPKSIKNYKLNKGMQIEILKDKNIKIDAISVVELRYEEPDISIAISGRRIIKN